MKLRNVLLGTVIPLVLIAVIVTHMVRRQSEIDRTTSMCNSISPGTATPTVLARLSEAGDFKVYRPHFEDKDPQDLGPKDEVQRWHFYSTRYRMYPFATCHIEETNNIVTSVGVFLS